MRVIRWLRTAWEWLFGRRSYDLKVIDLEGDELPRTIGRRELVRLIDGGEEWSAGMRCPCGCGDTIELMLLPRVKPRWDLQVDTRGLPTLHPSVWRTAGCRSHFWVKRGRVVWAR